MNNSSHQRANHFIQRLFEPSLLTVGTLLLSMAGCADGGNTDIGGGGTAPSQRTSTGGATAGNGTKATGGTTTNGGTSSNNSAGKGGATGGTTATSGTTTGNGGTTSVSTTTVDKGVATQVPFVMSENFNPTGYMPPGADKTVSGAVCATAIVRPTGARGACQQFTYTAGGADKWAGVFWQYPDNNWGKTAGVVGRDISGATKITFQAKGSAPITGIAFITSVTQDMPVNLTTEWQTFTIDLSADLLKSPLTNVWGGFGWSIGDAAVPAGSTSVAFYIDDVYVQ